MQNRISLIAALMLVIQPSIADTFYVGGSIGVSMIDDTASAPLTTAVAPILLPSEFSLNGLAFDSNETASGVFIGWNATNWLALEFGYTDLGNTGLSLQLGFFGTVSLTQPIVPIVPLPPPVGIVAFSAPPGTNAALGIEEWSITAKFRKSLFSKLSANWSVGVTRAQFEAFGQLTINEIVSLNPPVFNPVAHPYASPETETGFNFGLGFAWDFNDRFSADIGYRRHDTRVIDAETVTLRLIFTL